MLVASVTALWDTLRSKHELLGRFITTNGIGTQMANFGAEKYLGAGYVMFVLSLLIVILVFFARFSNQFHSDTVTEDNISSEIKSMMRDIRQDKNDLGAIQDNTINERVAELRRKALYY
jgi:Na+-transporting methylmalonyl-CoA/oxaloacetate decarboxylase gamma subunit